MKYKAIDIGCGGGSFIMANIHEYIPEWNEKDIEVTRLDGNKDVKPDILHNILDPMPVKLYDQYDLVYMSHVLEHIPWRNTVFVANEAAKLVKVGGYFLISVPSLEWACKELLRGNYNQTVLMTIYGGQDDEWLYHRSGFTRLVLEMLADKIGMRIYMLRETDTIVTVGNSCGGHALQHTMLMRKVVSAEDPAEAIA